jgi:tripartite-type tricarboxylate transporter receptor subunit TctC
MSHRASFVLFAVLAALFTPPAAADEVADFYRGKTITMTVGSEAGGGYDIYARLLARHLGKYVPGNPSILVQNRPGAASVNAANYVYNVAPQDGTVIGLLNQAIVANHVLGTEAGNYDVKKYQWIGRMGTRLSVGLVWHTAGVNSLDEAKKKEVILGATTVANTSTTIPMALNRIIGTRFKLVEGYVGTGAIYLAMERGEVQGMGVAGWLDLTGSRATWIADRKAIVLYQTAITRHADGPDVPALPELATQPDDRRVLELLASTEDMGRSFLAGPNVPPDRVEILRTAFSKMMTDPEFLADAQKSQVDINFMGGEELQKLVAHVSSFPPALAERARELVKP